MHASAVFVLAAAGLAAAQSVTGSVTVSGSASVPESGCGSAIDLIIQDCLSSTGAQLSACATNDWKCMCTQVANVLTCYNNCPSDPNRVAIFNEQTSWCNAAYPGGTSTTMASMTATASSAGQASGSNTVTSTPSANEEDSASSSGSASSSSASPTATTGAAAANVVPGALAAFLGLAALL